MGRFIIDLYKISLKIFPKNFLSVTIEMKLIVLKLCSKNLTLSFRELSTVLVT